MLTQWKGIHYVYYICYTRVQWNVHSDKVIQRAFLKHNLILYPFGLKPVSGSLQVRNLVGAPSLPVAPGILSLASCWSLTPELWDLWLPWYIMWFHCCCHCAGSYLCLDSFPTFPPSPASVSPLSCCPNTPCPSDELLHIPQDPA